MKAKLLLIVSLVLNCALMAAWLAQRPVAPPAPVQQEVSSTDSSAAARFLHRTNTLLVASEKALDWSSVESEDYREYIKNLRGIGCPEQTVRDIIIADVNKLYAGKIAALYPTPKDFKFWRVDDRAARAEERERERKRHELEKEKRNLIEELLGVDYDAEVASNSGRPDEDSWRYGFLSPEKQEQARALIDKYRGLERALWTKGGWTAENRAKFAELRAQREAELAQLLGPADFQQYQLRNSWTARHMREDLTAFNPNEEEFKKIYDLRKGFDDQYAMTHGSGDEALREQRRLAQQQLDEQLKALLGDDRFAQYQLSQDDRYREAYDFAQRNNLSLQTAAAIFDVRRAAEQERKRIENDPALAGDARRLALQGLSDQAKQALIKTLGEDGWNDYLQRGGGWVDRLARTGNGGHDHNRYSRH